MRVAAMKAGCWLALGAVAMALWTSSTALAAEPPRMVVIGATARSTGEIIWQALATGWQVTAVARDPGRIDRRHERLDVRQGDVTDRASIEAALRGSVHGSTHRRKRHPLNCSMRVPRTSLPP